MAKTKQVSNKGLYYRYLRAYDKTAKTHEMLKDKYTFDEYMAQKRIREQYFNDLADDGGLSFEEELVVDQRGVGSGLAEKTNWKAYKAKVDQLEMKEKNGESLTLDEKILLNSSKGVNYGVYRKNLSIFAKQLRKLFNEDKEYDKFITDYSPEN